MGIFCIDVYVTFVVSELNLYSVAIDLHTGTAAVAM